MDRGKAVRLPSQTEESKFNANQLKEVGNYLFSARRYSEAITYYGKAINKNPGVPQYFTNRALCHLKLQHWQCACADCQCALDLDAGSLKAHFFLGQAQLEMNQLDDAVKCLHRALELSKQQVQFYGDEIAALLRVARKRRWNVLEERRISQEIELQTYLTQLIHRDKHAQMAALMSECTGSMAGCDTALGEGNCSASNTSEGNRVVTCHNSASVVTATSSLHSSTPSSSDSAEGGGCDVAEEPSHSSEFLVHHTTPPQTSQRRDLDKYCSTRDVVRVSDPASFMHGDSCRDHPLSSPRVGTVQCGVVTSSPEDLCFSKQPGSLLHTMRGSPHCAALCSSPINHRPASPTTELRRNRLESAPRTDIGGRSQLPEQLGRRLEAVEISCNSRLTVLNELFNKVDERRKKREVPDYLCGKISFEILRDPVITPSGITYDRKDLIEHLQRVGHFDPVTRTELTAQQLTPNLAIKEVVDAFLTENEWAQHY